MQNVGMIEQYFFNAFMGKSAEPNYETPYVDVARTSRISF